MTQNILNWTRNHIFFKKHTSLSSALLLLKVQCVGLRRLCWQTRNIIFQIKFISVYNLQKGRIVAFPLPVNEPSISEYSNTNFTVLHLHVSIVTKNRTNQTLALVFHIFSCRHRGGWNTGSSAGCIPKPHYTSTCHLILHTLYQNKTDDACRRFVLERVKGGIRVHQGGVQSQDLLEKQTLGVSADSALIWSRSQTGGELYDCFITPRIKIWIYHYAYENIQLSALGLISYSYELTSYVSSIQKFGITSDKSLIRHSWVAKRAILYS